jgi:hypothetical protein
MLILSMLLHCQTHMAEYYCAATHRCAVVCVRQPAILHHASTAAVPSSRKLCQHCRYSSAHPSAVKAFAVTK